MNDSGMSFRRISAWLNRSGIKTHRGKTWYETSAHAHGVVKRMRQRIERIEQIKNRDFSIEVSLERLSDTFESLLSDKTLKGSLMELF